MPAFTSKAFTRWRLHRLRWRTSNCSSLLIYRPRKDERLNWPSWLIFSGRFTHIVVTRQLKVERRTESVRQPKTGVPATTFIVPDLSDPAMLQKALQMIKVSEFLTIQFLLQSFSELCQNEVGFHERRYVYTR